MSTIRDLMQVREIKAGFPVKEKNSEKKAEKNSKEGGKQIVRAGGPGSGRHPEHGKFKYYPGGYHSSSSWQSETHHVSVNRHKESDGTYRVSSHDKAKDGTPKNVQHASFKSRQEISEHLKTRYGINPKKSEDEFFTRRDGHPSRQYNFDKEKSRG